MTTKLYGVDALQNIVEQFQGKFANMLVFRIAYFRGVEVRSHQTCEVFGADALVEE